LVIFLWYLPKHGVLRSSPLQVKLAYGPFRGPYLCPLSPHCNSGSYFPTLFYSRTSCRIFFPPGPGQLSSSFLLVSVFSPLFTSIYTVSFVCPLRFHLLFSNFIFFFFSFPFLCFLLFHIGPSVPSCTTQTLLLPSLFTSV